MSGSNPIDGHDAAIEVENPSRAVAVARLNIRGNNQAENLQNDSTPVMANRTLRQLSLDLEDLYFDIDFMNNFAKPPDCVPTESVNNNLENDLNYLSQNTMKTVDSDYSTMSENQSSRQKTANNTFDDDRLWSAATFDPTGQALYIPSHFLPSSPVYNGGFDDKYGDYLIKKGDCIASRYVIDSIIGKGSFGQVVRAFDTLEKNEVAIKIVKNSEAFHKQAKSETAILRLIKISQEDPKFRDHVGVNTIIKLRSHFLWRNHLCLIFDLMSYNLYDLIKNTRYRGISLKLTRKFAYQILAALKFLGEPEMNIIHCDLKPENILLCKNNRSAIKLIDFGSSCLASRRIYQYIQSRFYRSFEVLIGAPYDHAIDMWSLACILVELHTGDPLFTGNDEYDQVNRIVETLGMPPDSLLDMGTKTNKYFKKMRSPLDGSTHYVLRQHDAISLSRGKRIIQYLPPGTRKLYHILGVDSGGPQGRRRNEDGHGPAEYMQFLNLLLQMLDFNPARRIKPDQALNHAFIRQSSGYQRNLQPRRDDFVSRAITASLELTREASDRVYGRIQQRNAMQSTGRDLWTVQQRRNFFQRSRV